MRRMGFRFLGLSSEFSVMTKCVDDLYFSNDLLNERPFAVGDEAWS